MLRSTHGLGGFSGRILQSRHGLVGFISGFVAVALFRFLFDEEAEAIGSKETNMQVKDTIEMVKNQILMGNRARTLKNADLAYDPDDRRSYNFDYISYSGTNAILFPDYMVAGLLCLYYHHMIDIDDEIKNLLQLVSLSSYLCCRRRS